MIKNTIQHEILIQTWLKILKAIIEPIALYGSEIWGPLKTQDFSKWEKEEIEIIHTQICKNILKVNRATPNNSCRAELGQYPLLINIQKRAVQFQQHLKCSDPSSYQAEALQWQEQNLQKSALLQLVLTLHPNQHNTIRPTQTSTAPSGPNKPAQHNQAHPNQRSTIRSTQTSTAQSGLPKPAQHSYKYKTKDATTTMELYLHLKRDYKPAEYLSCLKDHTLRKTQKYRLSDHCLAIERGQHRQRWQP